MRPPPRERLATTRRGFLRLSGSAAALGALARLPALPAAARAAGPAGAARFFDERRSEILTQVVERMVASGEPDAPRVRDGAAVATLDSLCARLDPALTAPLPWLLDAVEWSPILFDFVPTRFTRATDAQKDAALRSWMTSRLHLRRVGFLALRNLSLLGWYAQDESWAAIGYAGPLLRREAHS
jgi:hypothetical protein